MQHDNARWPLTLFVLVLLASALLGCMHGSASVSATGRPITVEIWASDGCPEVGQTITLRATVANVSSQTQTVELNNQPVLDIVVGPQNDGQRWSAGKTLTSDLTHLELKPGESKSIEMPWVIQPGTIPLPVSARFIADSQSSYYPMTALLVVEGSCHLIGGP